MVERYLKVVIVGFMVLLVILVSLQVFSRYIFNTPTSWSEEASNFTVVYLTFLGGSLAVFQRKTLRITFFVDRLPPRLAINLDIMMRVLIVLFLLTVIWYSFFVIAPVHNQLTTGLRWSKSIIFVSIPLGGILMLVATLQELREDVLKLRSDRKLVQKDVETKELRP